MHERVAWLSEKVESCAPPDDVRMLDEARVLYAPLVEAHLALRDGLGMAFGLSLAPCFEEAAAVVAPRVRALLDQWEGLLRARFGEDAAMELRLKSGESMPRDWWCRRTEQNIDSLPRGGRRVLRFEIAMVGAPFVVRRAAVDGLDVAALGRRLVLGDLTELQWFRTWARQLAASRASFSLELHLDLGGGPSAWPLVAQAFAEARPRRVGLYSWQGGFDRGPEPGGCRCEILLMDEGEVEIHAGFLALDPPDDEREQLGAWAGSLARAAGIEVERIPRSGRVDQ